MIGVENADKESKNREKNRGECGCDDRPKLFLKVLEEKELLTREKESYVIV